jgi:hypothetical protein
MLLDVKPSTKHKTKLQEALRTSNVILALQNQVIVGMQAQTVLQSMYLEGVQGQLQAQKDKKIKKRKTGKINMDGWAKILMQDEIVERVKEWQDGRDKAIKRAALKKKAKDQYSLAMDVWKVQEMDRKGHNTELKGKWEEEVREWGIERDNAKTDHRKPRWTKLKMPSMEKALRKPLLADFAVQDSESNEDNENDGDADPLMSDDSG